MPEVDRLSGARGFTLLELMVVLAIVGVLASVAIPQYSEYRDRAKATAVAADLKNFGMAFRAYALLEGQYPPDSHNQLPPGAGMEEFISPAAFNRETPLGGRYNWEGPDGYPYAGVSLFDCPAEIELIEVVDSTLDDGNLATGYFRQTPNGRYTYILEEF